MKLASMLIMLTLALGAMSTPIPGTSSPNDDLQSECLTQTSDEDTVAAEDPGSDASGHWLIERYW